MKVEINKDACIGCGVCVNLCGECFSLNEDEMKAEIIKEDGSCDMNEIATSCPVGAIVVSE